MVTAMIDNDIK